MTETTKTAEPTKGVVLVFLDEKGNAIAHAADFHLSAPGGFSLYEGQRARAKRDLAWSVCQAYASPNLTRAIEPYDRQKIMDTLCGRHGCKVHEIAIGHVAEGDR